jgi:hypothetical protein
MQQNKISWKILTKVRKAGEYAAVVGDIDILNKGNDNSIGVFWNIFKEYP